MYISTDTIVDMPYYPVARSRKIFVEGRVPWSRQMWGSGGDPVTVLNEAIELDKIIRKLKN